MRFFVFITTLIFVSSANSATTEYLHLYKVLNNSAIVVRSNGEIFNVEYGVGCISLSRFEGRSVLVSSPGIILGIGSSLILSDVDQKCRIWSSEPLGYVDNKAKIEPRKDEACRDGHWIQSVASNGEIITLEDGSVWQVNSYEAYISSLWLPVTRVSICGSKLINTDDGESVGADQLK